MAEVLVLAEHSGETVKKVTLELLTLARRLGEPAVVWLGGGAEGGRERLAEFGAAKVYVADGEGLDDYVAAPAAEVLASLAGRTSRPPSWSRPRPRARRSPGGSRSRSPRECSPTRWA